MRTSINTISPLIFYWSIVYVLALLSLYDLVAGILARRREAAPAKTQSEVKPLETRRINLSANHHLKPCT